MPGWYVVFPSSADDAKGLIKAAARAQDPVVFLEHKGLYRRIQAKAPEPDADYIVPFGRGRVRRTGTDVTIVAWGSTVYLALELARQMESEGRSLEVIDLRSMSRSTRRWFTPACRRRITSSSPREDMLTMGFGAEIAARITQNCFLWLDAPVTHVGARDSFVRAAPNLELAILPSVQDLRAGVEHALGF